MKKKNAIRIAVVCACVLLVGVGVVVWGTAFNTENPAGTADRNTEATQSAHTSKSVNDSNASWDGETATKIVCSGEKVAITGQGAVASGGEIIINAAGVYVLEGTLQGQVNIAATKQDTVQLVLNGIDIASKKNAAIYCAKADKLLVTLAPDTENKLQDAQTFTYEIESDEEPNAALFCKDDLTLEGTGKLTVTASHNNGIATKDNLLILSGNYDITAQNNGIKGTDSVTILDGNYTITSTGDGIQSSQTDDAQLGFVTLEGGTYNITSGNDGIQAETALSVTGGEYTIVTGGGHDQAKALGGTSGSFKGLKAGTNILVTAGIFDLNCADDALHADSNVEIKDGTFTISTGDDGMHAGDTLTISDGTIDIINSYEGLEGADIVISGGAISLVAADDGINAAGGDGSGSEGAFGGDKFRQGAGNNTLEISGGTLHIDAAGDGIDANGNINVTGGEIYVSGPTSNGNGALDYDGEMTVSGGTLIAAGSSGMAEAPGTSSAQASLMIYYSSAQSANTRVAIYDEDDNLIAEYTPKKVYENVVISAPEMQDGKTYMVYAGDTKLVTTTLSGAVTSISDTGEAVSGMMGGVGSGMHGGQPPNR